MTQQRKAFRPHPTDHVLAIAASVSLALGLFVYLTARSSPPQLVHSLLALVGRDAQSGALLSLPYAYQLPSFFHMLTLLLAAAWLTQRQPLLRRAALALTCVLGLGMELVQHAAVTNYAGDCSSAPCSWISGLFEYARAGTFDVQDLYAIALATLIALVIIALTSSNQHPPTRKDLTP